MAREVLETAAQEELAVAAAQEAAMRAVRQELAVAAAQEKLAVAGGGYNEGGKAGASIAGSSGRNQAVPIRLSLHSKPCHLHPQPDY